MKQQKFIMCTDEEAIENIREKLHKETLNVKNPSYIK